ncbi:MAG: type IV secretory system conjugative DNA transfer family protein [Solobacterium sp.]|jgi:type IV secretory pathway TraG/TraD family ATPase VirD4|nr:type IV secretory system conjugative DNA transfer family protein [Solobacterium sp.]
MKHFIGGLIILIGWIMSVFILAMQIAYFLSFQYDIASYRANCHFVWNPSILWWQGNDQYFHLMIAIIGLGSLLLILRMLMPGKNDRQKKAAKRHMTREERTQYSHLASRHEVKKGLQRIRYDRNGDLVHCTFNRTEVIIGQLITFAILASLVWAVATIIKVVAVFIMNRASSPLNLSSAGIPVYMVGLFICIWTVCSKFYFRDYCDYVYDYPKRMWNELMYLLKQPDVKKFNTLHEWDIGVEKTTVRSGLPVITKRRVMWVDASDSHTLLIGTTNSGKTWSLIHEMIEVSRMCGESMVVVDLKGELQRAHRKKLIASGYKVISINFIEPEKGDSWNPFGLVIKFYREAQRTVETKLQQDDPEFYKNYIKMKKDYLLLNGEIQAMVHQAEGLGQPEQGLLIQEIHKKMDAQRLMKKQLAVQEQNMPQPDFSLAFEYLRDVAMTIFPSGEHSGGGNDNASFWNKNGMRLLEGIVCFLLEYEYVDGNGNIARLDDDQINFKNFQMTVNDAFTKVRTDIGNDPEPLLKFYLAELRRPTDQSVIKLKTIVDAPEETRGSITEVFSTYMDLGILNDSIAKMTSRSSFEFDDLWNQKIAVFLIAHDEKSTYYPLSVLFMSQLFAEIARQARMETSQRLKYPLNIIWDEFGISPPIKNLNNALSAARSKGVRFTLVIQDFSQLSIQYNKNFSEMIKNNTMNVVYLLGGNMETLKEMSERIGNKLRWNKEKANYEIVPVVTKDRLAHMSVGEGIVASQRKNPYLTRYIPFNRYIFYRSMGAPEDPPVQELVRLHPFSLEEGYRDLTEINAALKNKKTQIETENPAQPVANIAEQKAVKKPKKSSSEQKKKKNRNFDNVFEHVKKEPLKKEEREHE